MRRSSSPGGGATASKARRCFSGDWMACSKLLFGEELSNEAPGRGIDLTVPAFPCAAIQAAILQRHRVCIHVRGCWTLGPPDFTEGRVEIVEIRRRPRVVVVVLSHYDAGAERQELHDCSSGCRPRGEYRAGLPVEGANTTLGCDLEYRRWQREI